MIITRKVILKDAPPLKGTEIAVLVSGLGTAETDGFTFGISRIALSNQSSGFTVEWGDGSYEHHAETATECVHAYRHAGLYRIRISDNVSSVRVSSGVDTVFSTVYSPMVKELRSNATLMTALPRIAFRNATGLETVELRGSSVRSLGGSTFEGCLALTSLEGCSEIEQLGMETFSGCVNLTGRVELPNLQYISAGVSASPFKDTKIEEFHFSAAHEEMISSLPIFYESDGNLGVEGAASYFDL